MTRAAEILLRFTWPVLILWGLIVVASAAVYAGRFNIDNSVGIWFATDDPGIARLEAFTRDFGETEWIVAVLGTGSLGDPEFRADLAAATGRIGALADVEAVVSMLTPGALASEAGALLRRPDDDRHTAILIEVADRLHAAEAYRERLIDGIRGIAADLASIDTIQLAGTPVVNAELNRAARRDMVVFYAALAFLVAAFGRPVLGNLRDLAVLLAVLAGTILPTLGLAGAVGLPFNLVTVMLPAILLALAASVAIHVICEFHAERLRHAHDQALCRTVAGLARPAFWTSATTMIGFLSLAQSPVAPVAQVGYLAAFGTGLGCVNALAVAPLLLDLLWRGRAPAPARPAARARRLVRGSAALAGRPRRVVALAGLAFLVCLGGLARLQADTDYVRFFRADARMNSDYRRIAQAGFAQSLVNVVITVPGRFSAADPEVALAVANLERALRERPGTIAVLAPRVAAGAGPALVGAEGQGLRLMVFGDHLSSRGLDRLGDEVTRHVRQYFPTGASAELVGTSVLWANMDQSVVRTQLMSFLVVLAALAMLLPAILGSLGLGLLGVLVSALPVVSILGVMGWAGVDVNVATCLIGGTALGLAIDDTIFLLSRLGRETASGQPLPEAVRRSLRRTGGAMINTSAITACCFLAMGLSDFVPTAQFGLFFAATVVAALVSDLLLLPALLLLGRGATRPVPA